MANTVYRNISCLVTNEGVRGVDGVRPEEKHLGIVSDAALVYSPAKGVLWAGKDKALPKSFRAKQFKHVSARHKVMYPGLVDPHTHAVFAGNRAHEFELRMRGASYQEIAAAGGGIVYSMRTTRNASLSALADSLVERLKIHYSMGVRLMEIKSGYGLDFKNELKSLSAIQSARKKFPRMAIKATCLAAHALPPEFKGDRDSYIKIVCEEILPAVAKKGLADYVDVFCDQGYFSLYETRKILEAGFALGLKARLHGEELAHTGSAVLAAEMGALSVDHLLKIDDKGISALAGSNTVAVLLPGTSFYLREPAAPARKLIDAGARVALATDFNPGSCPTQNFPFIGTLAALQLGMTTAEIITAMTWNAARSLESEAKYGALLPGYRGAPLLVDGDHPSSLFYWVARVNF